MACPYYQDPAMDELLGRCNDNSTKIPSETHQNCLCRSFSGIYANFCPIYAKFQRKELSSHKRGVFSRIFLGLIAR